MQNFNITKEFYEFGRKIHTIAICYVLLLFFPWIASILMLIYLSSALKNIKNILIQEGDKFLFEFRAKFIYAYILRIFGVFVLTFGFIGLIFALIYNNISIQLLNLIPILCGLSIITLGSIFEMKAWSNLNMFFKVNRNKFPEIIVREAIYGTDKLRTGNLLMLLSFLIIPAIIGWIYHVIGYFKLSELKNLMEPCSFQGIPQTQVIQPEYIVKTKTPISNVVKYCSQCGNEIKRDAKYCFGCGASLGEIHLSQSNI